ncbi:TetR/AcrR family transcriptional regulator [Sphingomonas yunnanensis]|uniref:TetR/AcrR family transcriptional regulator n=1 Tax=Sphingomonas yunnanensis TaxID=310400 RepID=UPI001CA760AD|nr:TetR/AcrR family transcriptional regulator [Sphingomonas yunnanensis]MBY9062494.1 TetR/AcrR family transcriptional regulator [Sphingomonas yunnanensis]
MRVSREQMSSNRARILDEAGRLFRERGFEGVTVADVMKAAGMTHGGFYGHFASKDALIAATIAHAMVRHDSGGTDAFASFLDAYLAPRHRDTAASGCPTAALAGLLPAQQSAAQQAMAEGLAAQIERLSSLMPEGSDAERRRAAIGRWSAMVGALILSRAIPDTPLSDEILAETRAWLAEATGSVV